VILNSADPEGGPRTRIRAEARTAEPRGSARTKIENPRPFRAAVRGADPRGYCTLIKQTISDDSDVYVLIIEYESE